MCVCPAGVRERAGPRGQRVNGLEEIGEENMGIGIGV